MSAAHAVGDAADVAVRDVSNRSRGVVAWLRSRFDHEQVDDRVLVARVRARIGGVVRHPRAIEVRAAMGRVTLRGPVLARDVGNLLRRVAGTRGVRIVQDELEVHDAPGDVSSLQGDGPARARGGRDGTPCRSRGRPRRGFWPARSAAVSPPMGYARPAWQVRWPV
jgi:hypothetical protein